MYKENFIFHHIYREVRQFYFLAINASAVVVVAVVGPGSPEQGGLEGILEQHAGIDRTRHPW